MKAQCDRCKEIVPLEFALAAGGIQVRCPACHACYFVAAGDPASPVAPSAPPKVTRLPGAEMTCPKCGEAQPRADACRRCGLLQARWRGSLAAADASSPELAHAREAAALWAEVETGWDDPARHDTFLAYCQKSGTYAFAASRYRAALAERPGDAIAERRLRQVRHLAELALLSPRPRAEAERTPFGGAMVVLGLIVLLVVGGLAWALWFRVPAGDDAPRRPERRAPAAAPR